MCPAKVISHNSGRPSSVLKDPYSSWRRLGGFTFIKVSKFPILVMSLPDKFTCAELLQFVKSWKQYHQGEYLSIYPQSRPEAQTAPDQKVKEISIGTCAIELGCPFRFYSNTICCNSQLKSQVILLGPDYISCRYCNAISFSDAKSILEMGSTDLSLWNPISAFLKCPFRRLKDYERSGLRNCAIWSSTADSVGFLRSFI